MFVDKRQHIPDGDDERCQCVRSHQTLEDGAIPQCTGQRWTPYSNLFCQGCEEMHGEAWKARQKEKHATFERSADDQ